MPIQHSENIDFFLDSYLSLKRLIQLFFEIRYNTQNLSINMINITALTKPIKGNLKKSKGKGIPSKVYSQVIISLLESNRLNYVLAPGKKGNILILWFCSLNMPIDCHLSKTSVEYGALGQLSRLLFLVIPFSSQKMQILLLLMQMKCSWNWWVWRLITCFFFLLTTQKAYFLQHFL